MILQGVFQPDGGADIIADVVDLAVIELGQQGIFGQEKGARLPREAGRQCRFACANLAGQKVEDGRIMPSVRFAAGRGIFLGGLL